MVTLTKKLRTRAGGLCQGNTKPLAVGNTGGGPALNHNRVAARPQDDAADGSLGSLAGLASPPMTNRISVFWSISARARQSR